MEEKEIKKSWKNYGEELQTDAHLQLPLVEEVKVMKAKIELSQFKWRRGIEATLFFICFAYLVHFIGMHFPTWHFMAAAGVLAIFALIGMVGCIVELALIAELDYSTPVTVFQQQLHKIKAYDLQILRLIFLSVPFYFAYTIVGFESFFDFDIYTYGNKSWLISNAIISFALIPASIWLYRKLSYQAETHWVRSLVVNNGGKEIQSALAFLGEIEDFTKEKPVN